MRLGERDPRSVQGRPISQAECAELLDVPRETVTLWHAEGLPYTPRAAIGDVNAYDSAKVITWLIRREIAAAAGGERPADRLARAKARLHEIEIEQREGRLVPADQVEPAWEQATMAAAAFMIGRASRLAGILETAAGIEAKRELLRREDHEFLRLLGGRDIDDMCSVFEALLAELPAERRARFLADMRGDGR